MSRCSPKTFLEKTLYEKLDNIKFSKRPKVSSDEFQVPLMKNYSYILKFNYNVSQLRSILRFYKQKKSGNKKQLVYRLYNFLKFSRYAVKIQALYRGFLRRRYNKLQGPAWMDRECVNTTDFLSLNRIKDISYCQFFSYTCIDNKIYGFNIKSLYNLVKRKSTQKNPYNRTIIQKCTIENLYHLVRIAKILKEPIVIVINNEITHLSLEKKIKLTTLSLFQQLDSFGHTTDIKWFLDLNKFKLLQFIKELSDIWNFRSELSIIKKKSICPPHGNPFLGINVPLLSNMNILALRRTCLCIIENIITKSANRDNQSLGTFYVLGALTIVNTNAANSLPWLFESFNPHNIIQ